MTSGSIRFAGLMPHAPILVPAVAGSRADASRSTAAMRDLARRITRHEIDTFVLISPHSPRRRGAFGVWGGMVHEGSLAQFRAPDAAFELPNDLDFITALTEKAADHGLDMWEIPPDSLDHGAVVPLWFLAEAGWTGRTVILSLSHASEDGIEELGKSIRDAAAKLDHRIAVIASGDMSHRLTLDAPGGFHPRGAEFDRELIAALRSANYESLRRFDAGLQGDAGEDALDSTLVSLAAADWQSDGHEVLSYEGPFGVGYGVAVLFDAPRDGVARKITAEESNPLPAIARHSVHSALTGGSFCHDTPLSDYLAQPGAVFVTLRTVAGHLRGCVGSVAPTRENIVQETWHYARIAAFRDPRFDPVALHELAQLRFEVSVLHTFEAVKSTTELDPGRFGVIVSADDGRRGLLLPAIPHIDSVEEQIRHARGKAGIAPHERVLIERFQVDKFVEAEFTGDSAKPWSLN